MELSAPEPSGAWLVVVVELANEDVMANGVRNGYRVGVRPDPKDRSRYLWTIQGIQSLFWEESRMAYPSVEQALAEANARVDQLA